MSPCIRTAESPIEANDPSTSRRNSEDEESDVSISMDIAAAALEEGCTFSITSTTGAEIDTELNPAQHSTGVPLRVPPGRISDGDTSRVPSIASRSEFNPSFNFGNNGVRNDSNHVSCPMEENCSKSREGENSSRRDAVSGQWKDGLCCCFRQGLCQPHLWNSLFFPQILMGHILMRMNLNWLAHHVREPQRTSGASARTSDGEDKENESTPGTEAHRLCHSREIPTYWTSRLILFLVVSCTINDALFKSAQIYSLGDENSHTNNTISNTNLNGPLPRSKESWWYEFVYLGLTLPLSVWGLIVVIRLRRFIRERYNIPPTKVSVTNPCHVGQGSSPQAICELSLGGSEDLICALCCNCCVLSQMARQVADDDATEQSSYCYSNELHEHGRRRQYQPPQQQRISGE